jgi:hypothetical protein
VNTTGGAGNTNAQPAAGTIDSADTASQSRGGSGALSPAGGTGNVSGAGGSSSSAAGSSASSSASDLRNGFGVDTAGGNRNRPITTDSRIAGDLVVDPAAAATSRQRR